jgi:hypothetical protein
MTQSRVEALRTTLAEAFRGITTANGYRNDVAQVTLMSADVDRISAFPTIAVILGEERMECRDDAWTLFDSIVDITVAGYASKPAEVQAGNGIPEQGEALAHDMKRVVAELLTAHLRNPENRWIINPNREAIEVHRYYEGGGTVAVILIRFQAHILFQDKSFND